ncbi:hypothetical protein B0O99DRAFT_613822 [Bisporella sp. PMI_857]|nr:hypothetical protein B0O99DRAFT_613822 [Bisporella sp. PMI_857]
MSGAQSKADLTKERQSNLPLPEDPPTSSDWNSTDESKTSVGSGSVGSDVSTGDAASSGLREPASKGSGVREGGGADMSGVGRQGKDGLDSLPQDAKR